MTNQSDRQADARSSTSTTLTYEGDSLAYFDSQSVPAGDYNGRLLAWINQALGTSYTEINGAKTALANNISIPTWDGLNLLGRAGTSVAAPNAPVLSLVSAVAGLMTLAWDVDNTVVAGDTLTRQVATDIGFTSIIDNTSHVITSGEDAANQITSSQYQAPSNGTYYVRGSVTSAATSKTSAWSNILTVVVADMATSNLRIVSTGNRRISSAGNFRKAS